MTAAKACSGEYWSLFLRVKNSKRFWRKSQALRTSARSQTDAVLDEREARCSSVVVIYISLSNI
jgi:hypothetical protein